MDHQFSSFIKNKNYKIYGIFEPIAFGPGYNKISEWNYSKKIEWWK